MGIIVAFSTVFTGLRYIMHHNVAIDDSRFVNSKLMSIEMIQINQGIQEVLL